MRATPLPLPLLLLLLAASAAAASPATLSEAKKHLARDKLVDVLTLLRADEGGVARGEERQAARLLADAAFRAVEKRRPELALQLAEASFEHDAGQPRVLELLGAWALEDGHVAQARRYAEFWVGVAPGDDRARAFQAKASAAGQSKDSLGATIGAIFRGKRAEGGGGETARPPAQGGAVVLYGTAWCTYCKQGRKWLAEHRIAFADKDIEQDPAARAELLQKAAAQGFHHRGVPVLDARGTLVSGFSPEGWATLLGR